MKTVKQSFILRKNKTDKNGRAPLYLRIEVSGKRVEVSLKKKIYPDSWDNISQRIKGKGPNSNSLNRILDQYYRKVLDAETSLLKSGNDVNAYSLKEYLIGDKKEYSLNEYFKLHLKKLNQLVGKSYSLSTYKKYRTTGKHLVDFINTNCEKSDIPMSQVDIAFLKDFEHYLMTKEDACSKRTAIKYLSHLRTVILEALQREIISRNPFLTYNMKYDINDPVYLTIQELQSIEAKVFDIERLERVKDVYLFCCYTGISYSDVVNLNTTNIEIDHEGDKWIYLSRTKTSESCHIPLLRKAEMIITKYKNDPETRKGNLLPVISNQKTNAYLKEIATICSISKTLTFHSARHTFATTVALDGGVSLESLQKILGHKDPRSTKIYGRITKKKIKREMKGL